LHKIVQFETDFIKRENLVKMYFLSDVSYTKKLKIILFYIY